MRLFTRQVLCTWSTVTAAASLLVAAPGAAGRTQAQWTITLPFDDAQATAAFGGNATRKAEMGNAVDRVTARLQAVLGQSIGTVSANIVFAAPQNGLASTISSHYYVQSMSVARDKLISRATADEEPQSEIDTYTALPQGAFAFFYAGSQQLSCNAIVIPASLNKHLGFQGSVTGVDGTITITPESATTKWQVYKGGLKPGRISFEETLTHECLHLLGFTSAGDDLSTPVALTTWDLFRIADGSIPVTNFSAVARELRPTSPASWITQLNSTNGVYKASSGTRVGGDGNQAGHWRSYQLLEPKKVIGVMDPFTVTPAEAEGLGGFLLTRADVTAMDLIGWNVNPNAHVYAAADNVILGSPAADAIIATGKPISFDWSSDLNAVNGWALFFCKGTEFEDDNPSRVYDNLFQTSLTIPADQALPPGEYTWYVVADIGLGFKTSEYRHLTVACLADFNVDLFVNGVDFDDFVDAFVIGGVAADINGDTFVNGVDFDLFVEHFEAGC